MVTVITFIVNIIAGIFADTTTTVIGNKVLLRITVVIGNKGDGINIEMPTMTNYDNNHSLLIQ